MTRPEELDARGRRLRAALAAVLVRGDAPELRLMHDWLDNWPGLGLVVAGMTHQGWDLQLTAYAVRDWRANFFPAGIAHSIVGGTASEPTARRAVQRGAWEVLPQTTPHELALPTQVASDLFGSRWEQLPGQFLGEVWVVARVGMNAFSGTPAQSPR